MLNFNFYKTIVVKGDGFTKLWGYYWDVNNGPGSTGAKKSLDELAEDFARMHIVDLLEVEKTHLLFSTSKQTTAQITDLDGTRIATELTIEEFSSLIQKIWTSTKDLTRKKENQFTDALK